MSQRDVDELVEQIETDAFDAWAFNRERGQYMGSFDTDECADLIAAHDAATLELAAERAVEWYSHDCNGGCGEICYGDCAHKEALRRAIMGEGA